MPVPNREVIDTRRLGELVRFANHSCSPNCVMERWEGKHAAFLSPNKTFSRRRDYRRLWKCIRATRAKETMSLRSHKLYGIYVKQA
ncbi:hypothetical protein PC116_g19645 [Phytophthora cactorum]|uniref:SET domain-containing protein n=1 Tax=Phytophthora cactorum TaxID=29920 RepID=A0A8T1FIY6_9STRA|nr:hypothetical protein PC112_g15424 [Phytophthora cactorum]KAG2813283.1 hypothetical protein PC111_g14452 [Phytophthora cactorum]KAG2891046.1 hypothetical protein PC114_g17158 [Phytophthora cactorum]KAG2904111.1 hypothetical protein PC115_g15085 [Phytophthora cactorum]KAG2972694.1 hypothetical protein PC118_g15537 [Phytophthora cactorum]